MPSTPARRVVLDYNNNNNNNNNNNEKYLIEVYKLYVK